MWPTSTGTRFAQPTCAPSTCRQRGAGKAATLVKADVRSGVREAAAAAAAVLGTAGLATDRSGRSRRRGGIEIEPRAAGARARVSPAKMHSHLRGGSLPG
eukprot:scaffold259_cov578-Prasinococcus_capsulatus_cf.AAC.8